MSRRLILAVAGLLVALTYLLVRAATPDTGLHERTLNALHALNLADAALQREVLMARAGLQPNYDPLVAAADGLVGAAAALQPTTVTAPALESTWAELTAAIEAQDRVAERFKSNNALLQNSLAYFKRASERLGRLTGREHGAAQELTAVSNGMLRFTAEPGPATSTLASALDRLAESEVPAEAAPELRQLVVHGRLILAVLPAVDAALRELLATPIDERARRFQDAYLDQHAVAEARARRFRYLLYGAAVVLLAYLSHVFVRLRANAHALAARLGLERAIGEVSAQFIGLAPEDLARGIEAGLARIARQLGVRAAALVAGGEADRVHAWPRAQAVNPAWQEHARAATVSGADHMLRGPCLCLPVQGPTGRVTCLVVDSGPTRRRWAAEDIALLRTAAAIFGSALDREQAVADRVALEARLRRAERMEAIGTLAGGIAHDFNNILGTILGFGEMAAGMLPAGSRALGHVRQVISAGERARGLVDQILAFSRRGRTRRATLDLVAVVREALDFLRASLPATLAIEHRLPTGTALVDGNSVQLQQVVLNLCTNAAQAMDGRGTLSVELDGVALAEDRPLSHGTLGAGRYLRLTVRDSGHGMDAATLERIFEPFFTTKPVGRGTGLGLASVHGIVADHGGALHVESMPGRGSTFAAYVPRALADACPAPAEAPAEPPRGQGEVIMVVDDERALVLLGEEMLAALGYEPVGYESAAGALAAFRREPNRFDLVLSDEDMAELTGTQLAAAIHAIRPGVPVILMTGHADAVGHAVHRQAGVRELLRKPLRAGDLATSIARSLDSVG